MTDYLPNKRARTYEGEHRGSDFHLEGGWYDAVLKDLSETHYLHEGSEVPQSIWGDVDSDAPKSTQWSQVADWHHSISSLPERSLFSNDYNKSFAAHQVRLSHEASQMSQIHRRLEENPPKPSAHKSMSTEQFGPYLDL